APEIGNLASGGVKFTNAFSTGTVCSPSRTTIITGIKSYTAGTGHHRSSYPIPEHIKGFPYYLRQQGYYTTNNSKTDYNVRNPAAFIRESWDESSNKAGWQGRKTGQPFFAVFNFNDSHQANTMTDSYADYEESVLDKLFPDEKIAEDAFTMPPFYRDSPEMRRHLGRVYNSLKLTDKKIGDLLKKLEQDNLRDDTIIFLFADHGQGIPRGKTNGINLGYRVPFVIWFPEKYRFLSPWGTKSTSDELITFEDLAPTLISLSGGKIPDHLSGRILMGDDRSPLAGHVVLSSDRSGNGVDMVRTVTDGKFIYSRNYFTYMPELRYLRYMEISEIKQQMRRDFENGLLDTEAQRMLFDQRPPEYLFDIENDPWELVNLAGSDEYKPMLTRFRNLLKEEVLAARDIMYLPEYEISKVSETSTPFEYRLQSGAYRLDEIYDAASLAGFKGADIITRQLHFLKSDDKIVRYWASVGLINQSGGDLSAFTKVLTNHIDDDYLPVSVTIAAIVYKLNSDKAAREILKVSCLNDDPHIALMAINYMLYAENKAPFIETIKQVLLIPDRPDPVKTACTDFLGSLGLIPNNPGHYN
ncbi:MAG: sulfatase, partial [Cytophagaceae bacterium SCN 52-12]